MRQSNIELLRIIAIFFVCFVHLNFSAIGIPSLSELSNLPLSSFLRIEAESLCITGVNIFILISGYFGISLKLKSICRFAFTIFFGNCILSFISVTLNEITHFQGLRLLIPGINDWFVQNYSLLLLLSPICNTYIKNTSKIDFKSFLVFFFATEALFGWLIFWSHGFFSGYSVIHFIGIYCLGRYLSIYGNPLKYLSTAQLLALYILSLSIIPAFIISCSIFNTINAHIYQYTHERLVAYTSPFTIMGSVILLTIFSKFKVKNTFINKIATTTFSVYLAHTFDPLFTHFKNFSLSIYESHATIWPIYCLLVTLAIYTIVYIIDYVRIKSFELLSNYKLN